MLDDANELADFHSIQRYLKDPFDPDRARRPGTVLVLPSMTMEPAGLAKIPGVGHYEERLLCMLQLLRDPLTRIVYVTSEPLDPAVVRYALSLVLSLPDRPGERLRLIDCGNRDPIPLTDKVLRRPQLLSVIRSAMPEPKDACIVAFTGSALERRLAVRLGTPLYAADPALAWLGTKTGSRRVFGEAGVPVVPGFSALGDERAVVDALAALRNGDPRLRAALIKLNDSFGAGGNALFSYDGAPTAGLTGWIRRELPRRVKFASPPDTWDSYRARLASMGAVVERFVTAARTRSPSVQVAISPDGVPAVLATQDQLFTGPVDQIYVGGTFPALAGYRREIQRLALRAGAALAARSVVGPMSIDFLCVRTEHGWQHYGLEINLRMGGGTAPRMLLHGLVNGQFEPASGAYRGPDGVHRCYFATDRLQSRRYRGLRPAAVVDATVRAGEHFDSASGTGVAFYMLGALDIGRLGVVAIDTTPPGAARRYRQVVDILDNLPAHA